MSKSLIVLLGALFGLCLCATAEVLIVADEFPAMKILAERLKTAEDQTSRIVEQAQMPQDLAPFEAVVVYIHRGLQEAAEQAFIRYAEQGGRLIVLHHSISSGKRKNRDWFQFLGVELPTGDVEAGGYKWTEDVTVQWVNLAGDHFIMNHEVEYPETVHYPRSPGSEPELVPAFTLEETEVYLNHILNGPRTLLMGLKYVDRQTGKTWLQHTAGWYRPAGKGWVIYFMPGHSSHDFENNIFGRLIVNAIIADRAAFNQRP